MEDFEELNLIEGEIEVRQMDVCTSGRVIIRTEILFDEIMGYWPMLELIDSLKKAVTKGVGDYDTQHLDLEAYEEDGQIVVYISYRDSYITIGIGHAETLMAMLNDYLNQK